MLAGMPVGIFHMDKCGILRIVFRILRSYFSIVNRSVWIGGRNT